MLCCSAANTSEAAELWAQGALKWSLFLHLKSRSRVTSPAVLGTEATLELSSFGGREGPRVLSHRSEVGTEKGQSCCLGWTQGLQSGHVGAVWAELAEVRLEVRLTLVPPARLVALRQGQIRDPKISQQETAWHEKLSEFWCPLLVAAILS